jgi:hypothetical protein
MPLVTTPALLLSAYSRPSKYPLLNVLIQNLSNPPKRFKLHLEIQIRNQTGNKEKELRKKWPVGHNPPNQPTSAAQQMKPSPDTVSDRVVVFLLPGKHLRGRSEATRWTASPSTASRSASSPPTSIRRPRHRRNPSASLLSQPLYISVWHTPPEYPPESSYIILTGWWLLF